MGQQRVLRQPVAAMIAAVLLAAGAVAVRGSDDPPGKGLARQLRQIQQDLDRVVPEERAAEITAALARATRALDAGRQYLALYEMESAFETTRAYAFVQKAGGVTSASAFVARWKAVGEPRPDPGAAALALPAVVGALAASAESRAPTTYRASLPYAEDSDVGAGLFYLGESQALGAYAAFARSLAWAAPGAAPPFRSLTPELDALDAEVTKAYERMTRVQHPIYILTSVTLKRARALNEAGQTAGALLEYLLARYRFAALRAGPSSEAPGAHRLAEARARLVGGRDHSIAMLFLEMAEAALTHENPGVRGTAGLIVNDVLPAYHAALGGPPPAASAATAPAVTITLVRWPFT